MANIEHYTRAAIVLHWLIAVLMIVNAALGLSGELWPQSWRQPVTDTHKSIGITVLGLALLCIHSRWERIGAGFAHAGLYLLILALPISGWLRDSAGKGAPSHPLRLFGLAPWPRFGFIMNLSPDLKESLHGAFPAAPPCAWLERRGL